MAPGSPLLELLHIYLLEGHPGALLWAPVPNHLLLANRMDSGVALDAARGLVMELSSDAAPLQSVWASQPQEPWSGSCGAAGDADAQEPG